MLKNISRDSGFSLMECLVVLSLLAILSVAGSHAFLFDSRQVKLQSEKQQLLTVLNYARQYAVLHHHAVTVCGSYQQKDCDGGWSKAWLLLVNQQVKRQWSVHLQDIAIQWRGSFGRNKQLSFDALGYARGAHGRFVFSLKGSDETVHLIVSPSGLLR